MTAIPGFGLAGADSRETGGQVNLLELPDGVALQQFKRRSTVNRSTQLPIITSWGITPAAMIFPDSISLSVAEEGLLHEYAILAAPDPTFVNDAVGLDAYLIFRARATLNISGKCNISMTNAQILNNCAWACAVGPTVTLLAAMGVVGLTAGGWVPQSQTRTELRTDWHTFNLSWTQVKAGSAAGSHILSPSYITPDAGTTPDTQKGTYTFTWSFAAEGFPTKSEQFQQA